MVPSQVCAAVVRAAAGSTVVHRGTSTAGGAWVAPAAIRAPLTATADAQSRRAPASMSRSDFIGCLQAPSGTVALTVGRGSDGFRWLWTAGSGRTVASAQALPSTNLGD